jgi:steroid 5-alpha reductase family enzyme
MIFSYLRNHKNKKTMKLIRLFLLLSIIVTSYFLLINPLPFGQGLLLILSLLTTLWIISLIMKDASIIDSFWGLGFAILAWFYYFKTPDNQSFRALVLCVLVTLWGVRLALHIYIRNHGQGEDYRYQAMRAEHGKSFWWISYLRVYLLQGFLLWIIAVPLLVGQISYENNLQLTDYLGIIIWTVGFVFEAIGDWQLVQFKNNPENKGKVMNTGLWKYTRHPNYFGDAFLWWGYYLFTFSAEGYWTIFSPILMTFLLMRVSGVSLLEKKLVETKPQYLDYAKNTPAFFPIKKRNSPL